MTDPMTPEELRSCREHAEAACVTGYALSRVCEKGTRSCGVRHHRAADVPRLLATVDKLRERAERSEAIAATASRNFAAEVARAEAAQRETAATRADLAAMHSHVESARRDGRNEERAAVVAMLRDQADWAREHEPGSAAAYTHALVRIRDGEHVRTIQPTAHVPDGETRDRPAVQPTEAEMSAELRAAGWSEGSGWRSPSDTLFAWHRYTADAHAAMRAAKEAPATTEPSLAEKEAFLRSKGWTDEGPYGWHCPGVEGTSDTHKAYALAKGAK